MRLLINTLKNIVHNKKSLFTFLYLITLSIFVLSIFGQGGDNSFQHSGRFLLFILIVPLLTKLVVQLLAALGYNYLPENQTFNGGAKPKVSVLLPAWNEEVGIIKTMISVLESHYSNFELIVINDGSTDNTHQLVTEFIDQQQANYSASIKYLSLDNGGKARALNKALEIATGEIIVTVDADCIMDADALTKFVQRFTTKNVGAVAGNVIIANNKKPIELIQQLEYVCGFFFKRSDAYFNAVHIIGGAAAAYRKEVLDNLRGFDEKLITEDIEMSMRILGHGYQTRYAHDAVIFTEGPSDLAGLSKQRLRWKYGRILSYFRHRELFMSSNNQHNRYLSWFILPLAVYSEILLMLQGLVLTLFYGYSIVYQDYFALASMIIISTSLVSMQILMDSKSQHHKSLLFVAPIAWLLLYFIDFVEFKALVQSLKKLMKQESLQWQKWNRVGIGQQNNEQPVKATI
ncbi:MAG: glycosyltransferase family 2 protein [Kangiellaceae bacterium]|nr:glycosyltransferase family 2 protein [Kangiellaceae bacterium]